RRNLAALLSQKQYDAVVCHISWTQAIFGPVLKRRLPFLVWVHGVQTGNWLERLASCYPPDGVIAVGGYVARSVLDHYTSVPVSVLYSPKPLPNPRLTELRESTRRELGIGPGEVLLIQASRLEPGKGIELFIGALAELRAGSEWRALIAGGAQ